MDMTCRIHLQSDWFDCLNVTGCIWVNAFQGRVPIAFDTFDVKGNEGIGNVSKTGCFSCVLKKELKKQTSIEISFNSTQYGGRVRQIFRSPSICGVGNREHCLSSLDVVSFDFVDHFVHLIPRGLSDIEQENAVVHHAIGATSSSFSSVVSIWDAATLRPMRALEGHIGGVYAVKFLPSGVLLLTAGTDSAVRLWSIETGQTIFNLKGHKSSVTCLSYLGILFVLVWDN